MALPLAALALAVGRPILTRVGTYLAGKVAGDSVKSIVTKGIITGAAGYTANQALTYATKPKPKRKAKKKRRKSKKTKRKTRRSKKNKRR